MLIFIRRFLKLYQIFGSSVVNYYSYKYYNFFLLILFSIHSVLSFSLILILIKFRKSIITTRTPSSTVNEYIQILSPLLVYFISITESLCYRKTEIKIWKNIKKCEELCESIQNDNNQNFTKIYKMTYILLFMFYSAIPFIPEMYNLIFTQSISWRKSYMLRILPFVMTRFNHLHYLLYIMFLKHKLDFINSHLKCTSLNDYKQIKKLHLLAWEISFDLSRRFGISETTNLLNYFLTGVVAAYWIFIRLVISKSAGLWIMCKDNVCNNIIE